MGAKFLLNILAVALLYFSTPIIGVVVFGDTTPVPPLLPAVGILGCAWFFARVLYHKAREPVAKPVLWVPRELILLFFALGLGVIFTVLGENSLLNGTLLWRIPPLISRGAVDVFTALLIILPWAAVLREESAQSGIAKPVFLAVGSIMVGVGLVVYYLRLTWGMFDIENEMNFPIEPVLVLGFVLIFLVFINIVHRAGRRGEIEFLVASRTAALQQSRRMLSLIIDHIPMRVYWKDASGVYLGCNRRFAEDAGYDSPEDIIGKRDGMPDLPESIGFLSRDDRQVLSEGIERVNIQEPLSRSDGLLRYVRASKIPIPDENGRPAAILGLYEDITEEREKNLRIENSERKYRALFQNSIDAIIVHDSAGDILEVNESAATLFGYPKEELESHSLELIFHDGEDIPGLIGRIQIEGRLRREITLIGKDNHLIHAEISASLLDSEAGIVQIIIRDISQRKIVEGKLKEAKEQAEEANSAKTQFIANMSHEIRTPMNAILGFTEVMLREVENSDHRSYLSIIQKSGKTLLDLINDILDLSKIEARKLRLNPSPVNIRELGQEVMDIFSVACERKGLSREFEVDGNVPQRLLIDEVRLRQILINLMGNALKFTDTGTIGMKIQLENRTAGTADLSFIISDTGMGIAAEQQQEIFQAFHQATGGDINRYGGTGLGLTITLRLAELMGGTIELESEPGRGSVFSAVLKDVPVYSDDVSVDTAVAPVKVTVFEEARVLAVNDMEVELLLLQKYFSMLPNVQFAAVSTGEDIVKKAREYKPQLVLLSVSLTESNALEIARHIRQIDQGRIPVIGITASIMEQTRKDAAAAGIAEILLKPVDFAGLRSLLARYLPTHEDTVIEAPVSEDRESGPFETDVEGEKGLLMDKELVEQLLDEWRDLSDSYYTEDLEDFARRVGLAAEKNGLKELGRWSHELRHAASTVDIEGIEGSMKILPALLESSGKK